MRKSIYFLCLTFLTLLSCTKEEYLPSEFDNIVGEWEAYEYIEYYNAGTPQDISMVYPVSESDIEYGLVIQHKKIEIYNAETLSSVFKIKSVELIIPDSVIINFLFSGYCVTNIEQKQLLLVYDRNKDEIVIQSGYSENNAPANLYLTSYKMIRKE